MTPDPGYAFDHAILGGDGEPVKCRVYDVVGNLVYYGLDIEGGAPVAAVDARQFQHIVRTPDEPVKPARTRAKRV